ncbi:hypothetical protein ARMGADRAFT_77075 [Armillaria gallica]|uniref:Uncharacterized protein n=1 Tax=Armillaria gallica TaxID=47427 RepID=A0A2H3CEX5_ARMGA|nr:hypothetical protein ARMGADRAFT_176442 [Armillaria gallica]PBK80400.1 hypothetical protein ARMGADRAFT_77075 [Armillaria gallica]
MIFIVGLGLRDSSKKWYRGDKEGRRTGGRFPTRKLLVTGTLGSRRPGRRPYADAVVRSSNHIKRNGLQRFLCPSAQCTFAIFC